MRETLSPRTAQPSTISTSLLYSAFFDAEEESSAPIMQKKTTAAAYMIMSIVFIQRPKGVWNQRKRWFLNMPMISMGMPIMAGRYVPRWPLLTMESRNVSSVSSAPMAINAMCTTFVPPLLKLFHFKLYHK